MINYVTNILTLLYSHTHTRARTHTHTQIHTYTHSHTQNFACKYADARVGVCRNKSYEYI